MSAERKRQKGDASDFEKALSKIKKEAISKEGLSQKIDSIIEWLRENGVTLESNGDQIEHDSSPIAPDEDFDELLDRSTHVQIEEDADQHENPDNLLVGNGNNEEAHKYKFYQFEARHKKAQYNAVGTDDFETIQSNEGRVLAIEHSTKRRKISLIAYAEDIEDETPFPEPEKSIAMLAQFGEPEDGDYSQFFLPKTSLSLLDQNNMTIIQGVIDTFMNTFISTD